MRIVTALTTAVAALLLVGCGDSSPPITTEAQFIRTYKRAFESGDRDTIIAMVKWDGVPDDLREFIEVSLTGYAARHKITEIEMTDFVPHPEMPMAIGGRPIKPNLDPVYSLVVRHEGNEGFRGGRSTAGFDYPVGIDGGVLKFCGLTWDGPPPTAEQDAHVPLAEAQPIIDAVNARDLDALRRALDAGARPDWIARGGDESTILHLAAGTGQDEALALLLSRSKLVNHQAADGQTLLHRAVRFADYPKCVRVALDSGADPTLEDAEGRTALDIADEKGFEESATLLRQAMLSLQP